MNYGSTCNFMAFGFSYVMSLGDCRCTGNGGATEHLLKAQPRPIYIHLAKDFTNNGKP